MIVPTPVDPEHLIGAVAVQGRHAYVGVGARLAVLDIADPARPTEIGHTAPFPAAIRAVAARGDRVYVGLEPRQDGAIPSGRGIRIVDASDPARPREVGVFDGLRSGVVFAAWDHYLYVPDGDRGLRVVGVDDPARPVEVGYFGSVPFHVSTWGWGRGFVAAAKGRAYVVGRANGTIGVRVLDVADPARIAEGPFVPIDRAGQIALDGGTLAIVRDIDDLELVDFDVPGPPTVVGRHSFNRRDPGAAMPPGEVWWAGRYVYIWSYYGLDVVDAGDRRKPTYLGQVDRALIRDAWEGTSAGGLLYIWGGATLRTLDATDPVRPRLVGRFEFLRTRGFSGAGPAP